MNRKKTKVIGGIILSLLTFLLLGFYLIDFFNDGTDNAAPHILLWIVIILTFFNSATWGNDTKAQQDELGQQIKK